MTSNAAASPAVLQRLSQMLDSFRKWESDPAIASDVAWAFKMCADALDCRIRGLTPVPDFNIRIPTGMTVTGMTVVDAQHQDGEAGEMDRSAPPRVWLQVDTDGDETDRSETIPKDSWEQLTWHFASLGGQEVEYVRVDLCHPAPAAVDDAMVERALNAYYCHGISWQEAAKLCGDTREEMRAALTAAMLPKAPTGVTAAMVERGREAALKFGKGTHNSPRVIREIITAALKNGDA